MSGRLSEPKRFFYIIVGTLSLIFGIIGIVLPVIPTTPFVLISAWCYYRGSTRFHDWLINHPYLGPIVEEYSGAEGISKESKVKAIALTWIAVFVTAVFILDSMMMRVLVIGLASFGTFVILRLKTRDT